MKFHKFIFKSIIATTTLIGLTTSGTSILNASASNTSSSPSNDNPSGYVVSPNSTLPKSNNSIFKVNNGLLTLDNIPNLTFSNSENDNSNILNLDQDNNKNDSNRLLEVTDYRNNSNGARSNWTLSATMGKVNDDSPNNNSEQGVNNEWEIDLFNKSNSLVQNKNSSTSPNSDDTVLTNGDQNGNINQNSASSNSYVMGRDGTNNSNQGYGVNQIRYNNASDAKLVTPNVASGQYDTSITWNLGTNVDESSNSGGGSK